jgi:hypothetical protein
MKNEQVTVRLPPPLLRRLDAYAAKLDAERPGSTHGRSDALKVLLTLHLPPDPGDPNETSAKPMNAKPKASGGKRKG